MKNNLCIQLFSEFRLKEFTFYNFQGKSSKPESSRTPPCPEVDDVYERMKEMHEDDSKSEEDEDDD